MKTILILLLAMVTCAQAQLVTKTTLMASNNALSLRIISSNSAVISRLLDTNTALRAQIVGTNSLLAARIAATQPGSFPLSNFLAMGITNIVAGTNVIIYTNNGVLFIASSGTGGSGTFDTNTSPVFRSTNILADNIESDFFNVGVLIPTNTVYITHTNAAVSQATNYVADFARSEQTITVSGAVNFLHATNLWMGATNAYLSISLNNFSGSDQTLAIPATWRKALNFPTILTNRTVTQLALKNYGGLSQSNVLAGAAQF